jgi:hypothetical protein
MISPPFFRRKNRVLVFYHFFKGFSPLAPGRHQKSLLTACRDTIAPMEAKSQYIVWYFFSPPLYIVVLEDGFSGRFPALEDHSAFLSPGEAPDFPDFPEIPDPEKFSSAFLFSYPLMPISPT